MIMPGDRTACSSPPATTATGIERGAGVRILPFRRADFPTAVC
jgi:hypothetical protein